MILLHYLIFQRSSLIFRAPWCKRIGLAIKHLKNFQFFMFYLFYGLLALAFWILFIQPCKSFPHVTGKSFSSVIR